MRRVTVALTALLIGSMIGGPVLAAMTPQEENEQQKEQQKQHRGQAAAQQQGSSKDDKNVGLAIHVTGRKSGSSSSWLSDHSTTGGRHKDHNKPLF